MKIFANKNQLQASDIPFITTFSSNSVSVQGKLTTPLKLSRHHAGITISIYVINDIPNVPSSLLGNDLLTTGMGSISYTGPIGDPKPEVVFNHPVKYYCTTYYESPSKLFMCQAQCTLGPYEITEVEFSLSPAAPIIHTDHILISSQEWETVSIFPTRSDVEFITGKGCYTAVGCVANLSDKPMQYTICGKYELVNEYNIVNLVEHNKGNIIAALQSYPLGREVLMAKSAAHIQVPLLTVHHISTTDINDLRVSDLDYADISMDKEPTFGGKTEIKPEIIEPAGLDLPTIIHSTASEAIDLSVYNDDVRPYITGWRIITTVKANLSHLPQ